MIACPSAVAWLLTVPLAPLAPLVPLALLVLRARRVRRVSQGVALAVAHPTLMVRKNHGGPNRRSRKLMVQTLLLANGLLPGLGV